MGWGRVARSPLRRVWAVWCTHTVLYPAHTPRTGGSGPPPHRSLDGDRTGLAASRGLALGLAPCAASSGCACGCQGAVARTTSSGRRSTAQHRGPGSKARRTRRPALLRRLRGTDSERAERSASRAGEDRQPPAGGHKERRRRLSPAAPIRLGFREERSRCYDARPRRRSDTAPAVSASPSAAEPSSSARGEPASAVPPAPAWTPPWGTVAVSVSACTFAVFW
jgi:hypothetical protein